MKIKNVPMALVKPYWRNANEGDVAQVKLSIEEFGMNQPLVVDAAYVIIVGHTRYKALLSLGWKTVPCVVRDDLPPEKVKKYRIADNKTRDGASWNRDLLVAELLQIGDTASMQPYFPDEDLAAVARNVEVAPPPTAAEIEQAGHRLETQFEGGAQDDAQVQLACPHCGETLYVRRKDILARTAVKS